TLAASAGAPGLPRLGCPLSDTARRVCCPVPGFPSADAPLAKLPKRPLPPFPSLSYVDSRNDERGFSIIGSLFDLFQILLSWFDQGGRAFTEALRNPFQPMTCPFCGHMEDRVIDSRES